MLITGGQRMGYTVSIYPDGSFTGGFYSDRKLKNSLPEKKPRSKMDCDATASALALLNQIWGEQRLTGVGCPGYRWKDDRGVLREIIWVGDGEFSSVAINTHTFQWRVQHHDCPVCNILLGSSAVPLGLSAVPIFQNFCEGVSRRAIKGMKGMTSYMRRLIRGSATILESHVGKDSLAFLTVTVPELSHEQLSTCWYHWQDMVDELKQYLAYHAKKKGVEEFLYVYCTEIQPRRQRTTGRAYPHLHLVYTAKPGRKRPWIRTPKQVRRQWIRILCRYVGIAPRDFPCENLQRVRKSVARYLSKYLAKQYSSLPINNGGGDYFVRGIQWGGVSRILLDWFRKATVKLTDQCNDRHALSFLECLPVARDAGILWYYRGIVAVSRNPFDGHECGIPIYSGFLRNFRVPRSRNPITSIRDTITARISLVCGQRRRSD